MWLSPVPNRSAHACRLSARYSPCRSGRGKRLLAQGEPSASHTRVSVCTGIRYSEPQGRASRPCHAATRCDRRAAHRLCTANPAHACRLSARYSPCRSGRGKRLLAQGEPSASHTRVSTCTGIRYGEPQGRASRPRHAATRCDRRAAHRHVPPAPPIPAAYQHGTAIAVLGGASVCLPRAIKRCGVKCNVSIRAPA